VLCAVVAAAPDGTRTALYVLLALRLFSQCMIITPLLWTEDWARLAAVAVELADRLAILVAVVWFPGMGAVPSRTLRPDRYACMKGVCSLAALHLLYFPSVPPS
jgi:hypothetical protein